MQELTKEQQRLVEENHNLIYDCLRKYNINSDDYYDLAAIGLCKAAMTFDTNFGTKFSTYAYKCMQNELKREFMRWEKEKKLDIISLNTPIRDLEKGEIELGDSIADPTNFEDVIIDKIYILRNMDRLSNTELEIVNYLVKDYMQNDIANKMGVSRQYINTLIKNLKRKLKYGGRKSKDRNTTKHKQLEQEISVIINNI